MCRGTTLIIVSRVAWKSGDVHPQRGCIRVYVMPSTSQNMLLFTHQWD